MRGILTSLMRQSDRLEEYKQNPSPENAIHIRFDYTTGSILQNKEQVFCKSSLQLFREDSK